MIRELAAQRGDLHVRLVERQLDALEYRVAAAPLAATALASPRFRLSISAVAAPCSSFSVSRVAITSGCLSVKRSSSSSSLAWVSLMRDTVSVPALMPAAPITGVEPRPRPRLRRAAGAASSPRRASATLRSPSAFLAPSISACSCEK
jgi:hypothetical protein